MNTILVPTDFSKTSNNAMMYAVEIAQRTGAEVTALYVVYPYEGVNNNAYDAMFNDEYVKQRLEGMKAWAKIFTRSPHLQEVKINLKCTIGTPVNTICQTAIDEKASLVVLGSTGATGLRGMLLGSITGGVLANCKMPVFVVPPKASFRNDACFALATDFKMPVGQKALQTMRELLYVEHTGLNIIHVADQPVKKPNQKQERAFSEKLGTIPHDFHYLQGPHVGQAIDNFLETTDCTGLVVVAHDHPLLRELFTPSVSRSLVHSSRVPVLVLHDA